VIFKICLNFRFGVGMGGRDLEIGEFVGFDVGEGVEDGGDVGFFV
jgi:hypothetical protein